MAPPPSNNHDWVVAPESVKALLDNLMLMSAFMFAFCSPLMSASFEHEQLAEADRRNLAWRVAECVGKHGQDISGCETHWIFSYLFIATAYVGSMLLVLALFVGVALYGVLLTNFPTDYHPNDVAGKAFFGKCWRWLFGPGLVLGYVLFIVGACMFFNASHLAVEMIYPRYSALPADFPSTYRVAISTMIERGVISAPGGTSEPYAMQLVEITESIQTNQTSFLGTDHDELWMGLHMNNSETLRLVFLWGTIGIFVLAVAAMLALRFCTAPKICTTKPAEDGDFENVVSPDAALQKWKPNLNGAGLTRATLLQVADDSRLLYEALKDAGVDNPGDRLLIAAALKNGGKIKGFGV